MTQRHNSGERHEDGVNKISRREAMKALTGQLDVINANKAANRQRFEDYLRFAAILDGKDAQTLHKATRNKLIGWLTEIKQGERTDATGDVRKLLEEELQNDLERIEGIIDHTLNADTDHFEAYIDLKEALGETLGAIRIQLNAWLDEFETEERVNPPRRSVDGYLQSQVLEIDEALESTSDLAANVPKTRREAAERRRNRRRTGQ